MNNLWKVVILSGSLLLSWCLDKLIEITEDVSKQVLNLLSSTNQEIDILESEQLNIEELIKELNGQYITIKNQRKKVNYEIFRLENLGVAGYKSNIDKIEKSKKLIYKYDLMLFEITKLSDKIKKWEISQKEANKEFRKIEKLVWNLFVMFSDDSNFSSKRN